MFNSGEMMSNDVKCTLTMKANTSNDLHCKGLTWCAPEISITSMLRSGGCEARNYMHKYKRTCARQMWKVDIDVNSEFFVSRRIDEQLRLHLARVIIGIAE